MSTPTPSAAAARSLYRRMARNLLYLAGGTGASALFTMGAVALMARALSPAEFGHVVLLQTSALILRGFLSFGTQQPIIRLGAEALEAGETERLGRIVGLGLLYDMLAGTVSALVALLIILLAAGPLGLSDTLGSALVFAFALLFTGYLSANGIFRLLNRFGLLGLLQGGTAAVTFAAAAALYASGAGFSAFAWLWAASMVLSIQLQLWTALLLIRRSGARIRFSWRKLAPDDRRHFFDYGWSTWGLAVVESTRMYGDSLLVGALVGVEAAGIYNVAKQVAGIVRKITDIYASAAFPEVSTLAARKDLAGARKLRARLVTAGGLAGAAGMLLVALAGQPLLAWGFGPAFAAGYFALLLLVVAAGLQLIAHPLAIYVQVFVSPARLFGIYAAGLALYLLAAPGGIFWLGTTGAALGQIFFSAVVILLSLRATRGALDAR